MDLIVFVKGLIVGLTIAAPVGPVGILCLKRTLNYGRMAGLASGLGAAVADTFYGLIAAFGLTFLYDTLFCCQHWLTFIGGIFLLGLGINVYVRKATPIKSNPKIYNLLGYFTSTFFLTLTNPVTILAFIGIFSVLGLAGGGLSYANAFLLLIGVFIGSMTWWVIIGEGTSTFRHKMTDKILIYINHTAGTLLIFFGLAVLVKWYIDL